MATYTYEYYTVKKGDTLSEIAADNKTSVKQLMAWNPSITDANLIYVGQKLIVGKKKVSTDETDTTPEPTPTNTTYKIEIQNFGLQSNTDRTVFATWLWDQSNTKHYRTVWDYYTNGIWFSAEDSTTTNKNCTYNAPQNATQVRFRVIPISETKTVNKKETVYWTAEWSDYKTYSFSENPPGVPDVPEVTVENYRLTAKLSNVEEGVEAIQFQVVQDNKNVFKEALSTVNTTYVQYACYISAGSVYKVRCRAKKGDEYSDWSEYSDNYGTKPVVVYNFTTWKAASETSVYLAWAEVPYTDHYNIQYTTKKEYFDGSDSVTTVSDDIKTTHYTLTNLEKGQEYFFRVRAVNEYGEGAWSEHIVSVVLGTTPTAPTTWSSTTTCIVGESLTLYWIHNSEDGSAQTAAEIEINGTVTKIDTSAEEEDDKTMHYVVDTSGYSQGAAIKWRVRTAGATKTLGEWSIMRTVDIYARPTLALTVTDSAGTFLSTINSFPFYIRANAGPSSQTPVSYHISIVSSSTYETLDEIGNTKIINAGQEVYSKYYDTSNNPITLQLSANSVDLENNVSYTVIGTVAMDSGLSAEASATFNVSWSEIMYQPNASLSIDRNNLSATIRPYCYDTSGTLASNVSLSVYRREFDGSFTEIMTGIDNASNTFITDPHPSLDYARYRIVATSETTGAISYYDLPGYPIDEPAIVMQWDEKWSAFDVENQDAFSRSVWSGSMLKLPYNINISDVYSPDVSLVKYIGRTDPVGYYGTQVGLSSTWDTVIPKSDTSTLYALRRLATWMGDVYVREPSGHGYWANVTVSYNRKHLDTTIPITLKITRVEGGA